MMIQMIVNLIKVTPVNPFAADLAKKQVLAVLLWRFVYLAIIHRAFTSFEQQAFLSRVNLVYPLSCRPGLPAIGKTPERRLLYYFCAASVSNWNSR